MSFDESSTDHAEYLAAWSAKNDAILDLKLINDKPAADFSHAFKVLTAILNAMDLQVQAMHASDRLKAKARDRALSQSDSQILRRERDRLVESYEQLRRQAAQIIEQLADLPSIDGANVHRSESTD